MHHTRIFYKTNGMNNVVLIRQYEPTGFLDLSK